MRCAPPRVSGLERVVETANACRRPPATLEVTSKNASGTRLDGWILHKRCPRRCDLRDVRAPHHRP